MSSDQCQNVPLEEHLCFASYAASHAIQQRYRAYLSDWGLTYPQYLVLVTLWDAHAANDSTDMGLTVSEIGERLYLDSGTLSPLLKRLEAADYISKQRSAVDNRRVTIIPTPKALELRAKVGVLRDCLLADSQLTPEELRLLRELSGKIARNLRAT